MTRTRPSRPWVGVGVVVWRDGQVLLVRRAKPPRQGDWSLPGGAQELGETVFETAMREVREETGLTIVPRAVLTVVDGIDRAADGGIDYHYTLVEVDADAVDGEATAQDDVTEVAWYRPQDVAALGSWPELPRVVGLAAKRRGLAIGPPRPRLKRPAGAARFMKSPLGRVIAHPWLDAVSTRLLGDWYFPMSRAWAAATAADGDFDAFCAAVKVVPGQIRDGALIRAHLRAVAQNQAHLTEVQAQWFSALFTDAGDADAAVAAEEARLDTAQTVVFDRLRFAIFARAHRLAACAWAIPDPETTLAALEGDLADPDAAFALPGTELPRPSLSRVLASSIITDGDAEESFLTFRLPDTESPCWARVISPSRSATLGTVVMLHGICVETEDIRMVRPEINYLLDLGLRVIAVEGPWHGRRRQAGRYGGEPVVATAPLGMIRYFRSHVPELAVVTDWARQTGSGPVGWMGTSLGAFTAQLAVDQARAWPVACQPDRVMLITPTTGLEALARQSAFARAFGVDQQLAEAGWTETLLAKLAPLSEPQGPPACGPEKIHVLAGERDDVAPVAGARRLAERWGVPAENVTLQDLGHVSIPVALTVDTAPLHRFAVGLLRD